MNPGSGTMPRSRQPLNDDTPGLPRSSRCLIAEWPLLAGWLSGLVLLCLRGHAFRFMPSPAGHNWPKYLPAAWMAVHGIDVGFPRFRNPLYPWLLGTLGEHIGYTWAGQLISSLSAVVIILAAGLGARALATPWVGAASAVIVPLVNTTAEASRWVNLYPLLGASTGATLALCACAARWPRVGWWLGLGLAAGIGWGIDDRSLLIGIIAAVGASPGLSRGISNRRRALLCSFFLLGLAAGPTFAEHVRMVGLTPMSERLVIQRDQTLDMTRNRPELRDACATEVRSTPWNLNSMLSPCSRTLLRYNADRLRHSVPFGLAPLLLLTPALLLPWRRSWRTFSTTCLVLLVPAAVMTGTALWVIFPDRYLLQFAAPLAIWAPVAISRVMALVARPPVHAERDAKPATGILRPDRLVSIASLSVLAGWSFTLEPVPRLETHIRYETRGKMIEGIRDRIEPPDTLMDCSGEALESALLPRVFHDGPPNLFGLDLERCIAWTTGKDTEEGAGAGVQWLVTAIRCAPDPSKDRRVEQSSAETIHKSPPGCRTALMPRDHTTCEHDLEPWTCPRCRFEAAGSGRWELEYEVTHPLDPNQALQLWRAR